MAHRNPTPSYLRHSKSGRARAVWTDFGGQRHDRLLPGPFNSKESKQAFAKLLAELAVSPTAAVIDRDGITVAEVLLAYLDHAERYYADADGKPTKELACMKDAIRPVRELYADTPVIEFGPLALRAVRQRMIDSGLCRTVVNRRVDRVKRVWRWAASEELVPVATYEALRTLAGLRRGKDRGPGPRTRPAGAG